MQHPQLISVILYLVMSIFGNMIINVCPSSMRQRVVRLRLLLIVNKQLPRLLEKQ